MRRGLALRSSPGRDSIAILTLHLAELAPMMQYDDGSPIALGDLVRVFVSDRWLRARVVMLGETFEHSLDDPVYVAWVQAERLLEPTSIVVEWVDSNPFAHNDPNFAPVGNYMITPVGEHCVRRDR